MREVEVVLDFTCCSCGYFVSATVRCSGQGLAAGPHAVAAVRIPCPGCDRINQLYFEPCGQLRAVEPFRRACEILEPSIN
jgi:phage FluMu protein Com